MSSGGTQEPGGLPRAWLFALACLPWLPLPFACYWQSDDFIAIHHVQDLARVMGDFVGPQYATPDLVLFYRPLITLSFYLDSLWGEWAPLVSHLENVLAHGTSALLLAALCRRLLGPASATAVALCWSWMPGHAGSILWAVGRVDSFTCVWILASSLLFLRHCEGRQGSRIPETLCFALALLCKELGLVVLGIQGLLALATGSCRPARLRRLLGPGLILVAGYFILRRLCLGVWLGGYEGQTEPAQALQGLGWWLLQIAAPLLQLSPQPAWWAWIGLLPLACAIPTLLSRLRASTWLLLALLLLGCALPVWQLWPATENPKNLRNFYLPATILALLLGGAGWRICVAALLCGLPMLIHLRLEFAWASMGVEGRHEQLRRFASTAEPGPVFGLDLPRELPSGLALQFDQGVDRLLAPPFGSGNRRSFALRPLSHLPGRLQLEYGNPQDGITAGLPWGRSYRLSKTPEPLPRPPRTALEVTWQGPLELDRSVLEAMVQRVMAGQAPGPEEPGIRIRGIRRPLYRVSVFTAGGYLSAFVPDRSPPGTADGLILIADLLQAKTGLRGPAASQTMAVPLRVATALDLDIRFPLLIEAGTGPPAEFQATHANQHPLHLQLFRRFASWYPL